jgi:hypothetical protein
MLVDEGTAVLWCAYVIICSLAGLTSSGIEIELVVMKAG